MRKFKLKKDLPGICAGSVLTERDGYEALFFDEAFEKNTGLVLHQRAVGETLSINGSGLETTAVDEWLEEITPEPEYKRWRADYGGGYYSVGNDLTVCSANENHSVVADGRYRYGNYFQTEEEAQALADYLKALAVVRDDAKGFKPDWGGSCQKKCRVYYANGIFKLVATEVTTQNQGVFGLPYFASYEEAWASIDKHEKEWKTIFGIED